MVSFALTHDDFDEGFRLEAGLRAFSDLAEFPDFAGPALDLFLLDLFLFVWAGLGDSRPAGFCAKAYCEKSRTERMEETKKIENRK
jgi:hypothetical protein